MLNNFDIKIKTRLFPFINDINKMKELKIDYDSIFYISLRHDAEIITETIKKYFPLNENECFNQLYITDATAGVGGNTISFGKNFKYVNSIEIDNNRFKYLTNNIQVYELLNVNVFNDNCLNILHRLYSDIIFIDPPWGGKDYKLKNNLRLFISNKHIEDVCLDIMIKQLARLVVLKLPLNYDIIFLKSFLTNYKVFIEELDKMIIVFITL